MYDVIIIGSGPAGLSATLYSCRAGLKTAVIENENISAGQISQSSNVENYLGFKSISGIELGCKFREHIKSFKAVFINGSATEIEAINGGYSIMVDNKVCYSAKTIIYAAGAVPRKLNIRGEAEFVGRGVSYCAICDGAFYKNKLVAVIGGGDTALHDALMLSELAEKVYIVHRRDTFRANMDLQNKVRQRENIEVVYNANLLNINGNTVVTGIEIMQDGKNFLLNVDGVFVAVGTTPQSSLIKELVKLDADGYVIADESGLTSANGIFAAGDVRTKKLRQIVTAVSDGANCAFSVEQYLLK